VSFHRIPGFGLIELVEPLPVHAGRLGVKRIRIMAQAVTTGARTKEV
jgi:hypothetical protein